MRARYHDVAMRGFELMLAPWRYHMLAASSGVAARAVPAGLAATLSADRPLLIVANHTSWWDGFLLRDLHSAVRPAAPLYTVMLQKELARLPFFRLIGAVPLEPGSPTGMLRLVRELRRAVTRDPRAAIVYFPQGRIWPAWRRPLGFARGIDVLARALAPCALLPVGIHIEPLNRAAPAVFMRCGEVMHVESRERGATDITAELEHRVTQCLDAIQRDLAEHGEDAVDLTGRNR